MQAVILVGGEGTRLRPLTSTVPKPVVPLVDRPFIAYMLEWLAPPRRRRRDHVLRLPGDRACATCSATARSSGCGCASSRSPSRAGTAGALKYAEDLLDERFLMLNGDVLTDIDLTAQIAQHEATGAVGTLALVPVEDPTRLRPRAPARRPLRARVRREADAPTRSTRTSSRAGAYVLERARPRPHPARPQRLDRARGLAAPRRQRPVRLRGRRVLARHRDARALPAGAPSTSSRATCAPPSPTGSARLPGGRRARRDRRPRRPAGASSSAAAGSRRARTSASLVVLGDGVTVGEGSNDRALGRAERRRDRRRAACCATASSPRACASARARIVSGGAVLGEGVTVGERNVLSARRASLPADRAARWRDHVLTTPGEGTPTMSTTEGFALDRETIARVDVSDQLTDILAIPEHLRDALWKVESAGLELLGLARAASSSPGWAARRSAASSRARSSATTPRARCSPRAPTACRRGRRPTRPSLCASYSGNTEETLACYEAAGRLGARRVVVTTGGKLAELARADGVPVIPLAGGFQPRAAVAYMTVAALEVAALSRRRSADELRDRRRRRPPRGARHRVGARRRGRRRGQDARPRAARHRAGHRRRRPDDADRLPLEDADQREREDARRTRRSCRRWTTTRSRAGRRRASSAASPRSSSTTTTPIRASGSGSSSRARLIEPGAAGVHRVRLARPDHGRARLLARAARRPRVALPRGPAGRRPRAGGAAVGR